MVVSTRCTQNYNSFFIYIDHLLKGKFPFFKNIIKSKFVFVILMIQEKNLNKEQIEAVNFVNGNLLIIASAGTGKTTTIVERYSNLIKNHNYKPNEILMTTFTNKAAKDMINKIFEKTNTKPIYIGTMHSIFLRILRENASTILPNMDFTIIDDPDKKIIIKKILDENKIEIK